jgi:hypothetical protein
LALRTIEARDSFRYLPITPSTKPITGGQKIVQAPFSEWLNMKRDISRL